MYTHADMVVLAYSPGDAKMLELALGTRATWRESEVRDGEEVLIVFPRSQHRKAKGVAKRLAIYKRAYPRVLDMDAVGQATVRDLIDAYGYDGAREILLESEEFAKPLTVRDVASGMVRGLESGAWAAWKLPDTNASRVLHSLLAALARPRPLRSTAKKIERQKFGTPRLMVRRAELLRVAPMNLDVLRKYLLRLEEYGYVSITSNLGGLSILLYLDRIAKDFFVEFYSTLRQVDVRKESSPYLGTLSKESFKQIAPVVKIPFYDAGHELNASLSFLGFKEINNGLQPHNKGDASMITPEKPTTHQEPKIHVAYNVFGASKAEWSPRHAFAFMLINAGASVRAAARAVGVSHSTLLAWIENWRWVYRYGSQYGAWVWLTFLERMKRDLERMPSYMRHYLDELANLFYPHGWLAKKRRWRFLFGFQVSASKPRPGTERMAFHVARGAVA